MVSSSTGRIEVSAFSWVPPFAEGYVRDLRVRWALEEAGLPYHAALIDQPTKNSPDYRQWQPFGQVPAYRDGEVELFESGAIVLHIAAQSEALAPKDRAGFSRVMTWAIAALNSIEPFTAQLGSIDIFHAGENWTKERRPQVESMIVGRLEALNAALGNKDYLEGRFTAADIIMTTVLRELVNCGLLARFPTLDAYRKRNEARPAFRRALKAQLDDFARNRSAKSA